MDAVTFVHARLGMAILFYLVVCGVWGAVEALRGRGVGGSYLGALFIAAGMAFVQALLGTILMLSGRMPGAWLHFVYGILVLGTIPVAYSYARTKSGKTAAAIYAVATLIAAAAAVRALGTGA